LKVAAINHAPKRKRRSFIVARPFLLVTRRAIPAKSRLHNASDNRVDQRMPKNKVAQQIIQEKAVVL